MAIRKNKKRIDPRYFLHETTYRDLNEGISPNLAKGFVEGGFRGWDSETAKSVYDQWTKADGLRWNALGDFNPATNQQVPGSYHFATSSEDKDHVRKAFDSQAIKQAVQAYNEALAANDIPGQVQASVSWAPRDQWQKEGPTTKIGVILTISPAQQA